jgi:hypothetical protein
VRREPVGLEFRIIGRVRIGRLQNEDSLPERIFEQPLEVSEDVPGFLEIKLSFRQHKVDLRIDIEKYRPGILAENTFKRHTTILDNNLPRLIGTQGGNPGAR